MTARVCACAAILVGLALAGQPAVADERERLERIRIEIEAREARAAALASEAEGYLGELEAIDRQLVETRRSLVRLRRREREAEEELSEARAALGSAERSRAQTERALRKRLVALYKFRATGGVLGLAQVRDFQAYASLSRGLARVLDQDADLFSRYSRAEVRWRSRRAEAQELAAELHKARAEISAREERVRQKGVERRNLASLLHSRADRERRVVQELRDAAARLEEAIRALPAGRGPAGPGLVRLQVPHPVAGSLRLAFGRQVDPEFGTETLRTGIEIEAPSGASVIAVAAGRVLFAGWFRGYGQMVILDHGRDTMTISGYLEELAVAAGESVAAGQEIGRVGQTGSLSSPGLYFEIRKDGVAVDPEPWLE